MKTCVVVIPIYKVNPSQTEAASFRQGLSILGKHPICIITYRELDISFYNNESKNLKVPLLIEYFDQRFFSSVSGYNKLCLNPEFYQRFNDYKYMLIYQTDAWVFCDKLLEWCHKGYDFIGAPWYYHSNKKNSKILDKAWGIGNGGFNLRKISYCLDVLRSKQSRILLKPFFLLKMYWAFFIYETKDKAWWLKAIRIPLTFIGKCFGIKNTLQHAIENDNEDIIFSLYAKNSWHFHPHLPTWKEASLFAFEAHPSVLYKQNNCQLPFGCHAFEKYEFKKFWAKHIEL